MKEIRSYLMIAVCLLVVITVNAQDGRNGNLVSVSWLEKNLANDDILLFDASPSQIYAVNHIPGAISYDIFNYGIRDMETAEIEKRYQAWGISEGKKIVMYDQGGTYMATRLFFSLYYYGFPAEDLYVLDGGLFKWQEKGLPVTKDIPTVTEKGTFTIKKINEDVKSGLAEFLTASGDPQSNALVEALDPEWHFGNTQFFNKPGHIPNAILLPGTDFYNPDKTFKSAEEIRKMMDYMDIRPEQTVYSHCGGGIAASVPFFALKFLLDYPNVKLYQGSQLEWLSDPRDLPFWTYDAPYLVREASWLKFRGGKMARMYGISNVVMVDVRSPEEFKQGHLPFAINIPSGVFSRNMNDPGKLAKILDSANVNIDYEVVIISGAGLTKEAAIAFIMMEKLGQTKTSIFSDTEQKWAEAGFTVISDSTETSSQTAPAKTPVPSVEQARHYREGILVAEPLSAKGLYEKVYIASGKDVPSKTFDGKVIHIPYTDLLNPDGTVKAAKDIWTLLSGAGVPRYAELVCYSDDPGEAAGNYFILKLMGFPDIKVMGM